MSTNTNLARLRNGQTIPRIDVTEWPFAAFRRAIVDAVAAGQRVAALFGHAPLPAAGVELFAVLADRGSARLQAASTRLESEAFRALSPDCPQVHLFEREIAEQFGVRPEGHPWLKPVRFLEGA